MCEAFLPATSQLSGYTLRRISFLSRRIFFSRHPRFLVPLSFKRRDLDITSIKSFTFDIYSRIIVESVCSRVSNALASWCMYKKILVPVDWSVILYLKNRTMYALIFLNVCRCSFCRRTPHICNLLDFSQSLNLMSIMLLIFVYSIFSILETSLYVGTHLDTFEVFLEY